MFRESVEVCVCVCVLTARVLMGRINKKWQWIKYYVGGDNYSHICNGWD